MEPEDQAKDTPENRKKWIDFLNQTAIAYLLSAAKIKGVAHLFDAHIIQFREDGWTIQHPIRERIKGTLFSCPIHEFSYENFHTFRGYYWLNEDGSLKAVIDKEDMEILNGTN